MSEKMYVTPQPIEKYLDRELECDCGHTHYVPIKGVEISSGAINTLPAYTKKLGYEHPYILCDEITYKIAGKRCEELLKSDGIDSTVLILKHLSFDEATLGEIIINLPENCDLMIGVGTWQKFLARLLWIGFGRIWIMKRLCRVKSLGVGSAFWLFLKILFGRVNFRCVR